MVIDPKKVKQRKLYLESSDKEPTINLSLLSQSARKGNIVSLQKYINEWSSYSNDNTISFKELLDVYKSFDENCKCLSDYNQAYSILENKVIPKVRNMNDCIYYISSYISETNCPSVQLLDKCNEIKTYDRIINNQKTINENLKINDDTGFEDIVYGICNMINESNLSDNEKYAITLENVLYTLYENDFIEETYDESELMVNLFFNCKLHEDFDYDNINDINHKSLTSDQIDYFANILINTTINNSTTLSAHKVRNIEKYINVQQLKRYEKKYKLIPVKELDSNVSRGIDIAMHNDPMNFYGLDIENKSIGDTKYKTIYFFNQKQEVLKISLVYTRKIDTRKYNLVLVPIFSSYSNSRPTVIDINGRVTYGLTESVDNDLFDIHPISESHFNKADLMKDLKKLDLSKPTNGLKNVVTKYFTRPEQSIIDGIPSVFTCVRAAINILVFNTNPYIGIPVILIDRLIAGHMDLKNSKKVLTKYKNEIEDTRERISKEKDPKKKKELEKYLKSLISAEKKLLDYYNRISPEYLYGAGDQDEDDDFAGLDLDDDDDDFDFDDDDDFEESTNIVINDVILNEMNILNNLRLVQNQLKKKIQKVSDKDRELSRKLDHAYDNFVFQAEKQMSNKNREAVIKGNVLPSFSALIKLTISSVGAGMLIDPALGAIVALVAFATSKRATEKERQYILEEIDIQLEVVEKKLQLAENNNDMKAYEQLLKIKKKLQSERSRIIYKKRNFNPATSYKEKSKREDLF